MNAARLTKLRLGGWLAWLSLLGVAGAAQPADLTFRSVSAQLQAASTSGAGVDGIVKLANQAANEHGQSSPMTVARVYRDAAHLLSYYYQTNRSVLPAYREMVTRQRDYLDSLPLAERLDALNSLVIPLDMEVKLAAGSNGSPSRGSELELLLATWQELVSENHRVKDWPVELPGPYLQPPRNPGDLVAQLHYQEANARSKTIVERITYLHKLRVDGGYFTNRVVAQVATEFGMTPQSVAKLQEVMDGYLPPEVSTNVMNKVFAAMKSAVAAKTPRPVPGAKGERWLRAPPPAPEPQLPAIARPSKLRERLAAQGLAGMVAAGGAGGVPVAGAEVGAGAVGAAGGTSGWVWAGLGLVVLAGGWVWLRQRS